MTDPRKAVDLPDLGPPAPTPNAVPPPPDPFANPAEPKANPLEPKRPG